MIHFLKLEIVANVGKFLFGVLRQIVIALFIYLFFFNEEIKHYESEGRKMWLEDLRRS